MPFSAWRAAGCTPLAACVLLAACRLPRAACCALSAAGCMLLAVLPRAAIVDDMLHAAPASCFSYVCCMLHAVCSLVCAACRLPLAACRLRKMGAKLWCRTRHACPEQHSRWQLHMHPIVFWWLPPTPIPAPWAHCVSEGQLRLQ